MNVHLFGAASSPGCANYGLQHLAKELKHIYPLGSQFIMRNFYVDDGITSVDKAESAIQLAQEARELCAKGGQIHIKQQGCHGECTIIRARN